MDTINLGPAQGKIKVLPGEIIISVPLQGEQRLPISSIQQVTLDKPAWYSAQSRKRTIYLHGAGGPIATVNAIGKHGDRAYEALVRMTDAG